MIEVKGITKKFGEKTVLDNVSIEFVPGKNNLIIGESGSGKSVMLKCMVGLLETDAGEIIYSQRNFTTMKAAERKEVRKEFGMLFQGSALFDSLTVEENVMFPLNMYSSQSEAEKLERVNFCLQRVNLPNTNQLFPAALSGGMKKRVAIARAMALNPKYLFCDEPNSGLDPRTSALIDELIDDLTSEYKMTTVVITHDMNSVVEIGDHINFLYKSKVIWKGAKSEVLDTDCPELNAFIYSSKLLKSLKHKIL